MPTFVGWIGPVTGEGITPLSGGIGCQPVSILHSIDAITSPRVRVLGLDSPHRLQYAGSFGFSYNENDALGSPQDFVVWEHIINWEYMDLSINTFIDTGNEATDFWWRLSPGVSSYLGVWLR